MPIEMLKTIDKLAVDRDLVFQFFAVFSRFECSLKRTGFLKKKHKAEANWVAYANSLRGRFGEIHIQAFEDAIRLLIQEPPRTQVVAGVALDWCDTVRGQGEHDERYILRLVTTVRNNLFHGGKYPSLVGRDDMGRNRKLLQAGITVLGHCLDLSENVRSVFEETA
jgi:hypothetical protein